MQSIYVCSMYCSLDVSAWECMGGDCCVGAYVPQCKYQPVGVKRRRTQDIYTRGCLKGQIQ